LEYLGARSRTILRDPGGQRSPIDQVGPHADPAVVDRGTVDREHVWMAHTREPARLEDVGARSDLFRTAQLERDVAFEHAVERAIYLAVTAAADAFEHFEVTPAKQHFAAFRLRLRPVQARVGADDPAQRFEAPSVRFRLRGGRWAGIALGEPHQPFGELPERTHASAPAS